MPEPAKDANVYYLEVIFSVKKLLFYLVYCKSGYYEIVGTAIWEIREFFSSQNPLI